MKNMRWRTNFAVLSFLYHQILPKDRPEKPQEIFVAFYILHLVLWQKLIHNWC